MPGHTTTSCRNYSLDLIKFIAMCLVVCLHTTHYYIVPGVLNIEYILYNTSVVAIPLFFMVSGYLIIVKAKTTYRYVARKIWGIIRFILPVVGCWWIVHSLLAGWSFRLLVDTLAGVLFQNGPFGIFWYFSALCILYIAAPLVHRLARRPKYYIAVLIVICMLQNLMFCLNLVDAGERGIFQAFRIWNWLFYFMLGGALRKLAMNRLFLTAVIFSTGVLNIFVIRWLSPFIPTTFCEFFYGCPVVIVFAGSIFIFCKQLSIGENRLTRGLAPLFLPVYTFHWFISAKLADFGLREFGGLTFYLVVLFCTLVISWLIMKIPYINKVFRI